MGFRYEVRATGWGRARHQTRKDALKASAKAEAEGRPWWILKRRFLRRWSWKVIEHGGS